MNYLMVISVDNTIEGNYRTILYPFLQKLFFFAVFVFNINRKMIFLKNNLKPQGFFYKRKVVLKKLSILNNINIKNRTRNKVVNKASPKSSSPRPLRAFSIVFSCIRKSNKVW